MNLNIIFITIFICSALLNRLFLQFFNGKLCCDDGRGVQKIHPRSVPKLGGCAVYLVLLISSGLLFWARKTFADQFLGVFLCAFPLFLSGLLEDFTGKIPPTVRLAAGLLSGALVYAFFSAKVIRVEIPGFDRLLEMPIFSFLFTIFSIAGVSHAFNIIDGLNGLSSGVALIVFGAYGYLSFEVKDVFVFSLSLTMFAATLGFFFWNYPFGFIFLGDSGAYLLGYTAAICGIFLTLRHTEVSPWFPLLLVVYPVWETLFSAYRRRFLKETSPVLPDALHLHTIIFRRLTRSVFGKDKDPLTRNALATPLSVDFRTFLRNSGSSFLAKYPLLSIFYSDFYSLLHLVLLSHYKIQNPEIFSVETEKSLKEIILFC